MKKIFAFIILMLPLCVVAQNKLIITDTFDGGRFQWDEYFGGNYTVSLMDGYYLIENKEDNCYVYGTADLPIEIEKNFSIKLRFSEQKK